MTIVTIEKLRVALSKERLVPYGGESDEIFSVIEKYNENIKLCEAMYPALHYLEVLLRNHINNTFEKVFYKDWLLNIPAEFRLPYKNKLKIDEIKEQFFREKKKAATHADLVSLLSFGFWCAFFHKKFDPTLWHRKHVLRSIFPYLKLENQTRKYIEHRLLRIKMIRNRIAHHERIWGDSGDCYQLYAAYKDCVELICAMSESSMYLLKQVDRLPEVYRKVSKKTQPDSS